MTTGLRKEELAIGGLARSMEGQGAHIAHAWTMQFYGKDGKEHPVTPNVLQQPSFFQFLSAVDIDLANRARLQGYSFCAGAGHAPTGDSMRLSKAVGKIRANSLKDGARPPMTGFALMLNNANCVIINWPDGAVWSGQGA